MYSLGIENVLSFAVHGGGDSPGIAGNVDDLLSGIESLLVMSPAQMFAELLPGIATMQNYHPLLVHFPIALLSLFFVMDLVGSLTRNMLIRDVASWFLYWGTVFAAGTVVLGLHAASTVAHGDDVHMIMEHHEHLGISVLSLAMVLSAWRLFSRDGIAGSLNTLHLSMAGILAILLAFTADLGGLMVYGYGVAVAPVAAANQDAAMAHQHGGASVEPQLESAAPAADATTQSVPAAAEPAVEPVKPKVHTHADGSQHVHSHDH